LPVNDEVARVLDATHRLERVELAAIAINLEAMDAETIGRVGADVRK
jgi:hypothetical protein